MANDADTPLWEPSDVDNAQTTLFRRHINGKYHLSLKTYEDLWKWSTSHRADFWSELWEWEDVKGIKDPSVSAVDEKARPSDNPPWFPAGSVNWAESQLRYASTHPSETALIQASEPCEAYAPTPKYFSQNDLFNAVANAQGGMKAAGLKKGDRVAFWGGNCFEAVVVMLASAALGAIFSSAAADFGMHGVSERLEQVSSRAVSGFLLQALVVHPDSGQ